MRTVRLSNRLPVILAPDRSRIAAVVIGFSGGGRHEPPRLNGYHHACEHVLVGPTKTTPDPLAFAREHEKLCRDLNAETDETSILVYAETDRRRLPQLIRFMADLVRQPLLTKAQFEHERERVREEIGDWIDEPINFLDLKFQRLVFQGTDLAHGSLGTYAGITHLGVEDIRRLYRQILKAERMVISLTGGFNPAAVQPILEQAFGDLPLGIRTAHPSIDYRRLVGQVRVQHRPLEKIQVILGWPLFGIGHPDRIAFSLLRNHLTTRESSPVRFHFDVKGEGYSSNDHLWHWGDAGWYCYSFAVFRPKLLDALRHITAELERVRSTLISSDDLERAQVCLELEARKRFSDPLKGGMFYARQYINLGRVIGFRQYRRALRDVRRTDIRRLARSLLVRRRLFLIAQGKLQGLPTKDLRRALGFHH